MRKILLALLVAAMVGAIGCGGDDETTAAAPTPSKPQFISQTDAICDQDSREIPATLAVYEERAASTGRSQEDMFRKFADEVLIPILETRLEKIRALGTPKGDKQEVEAFLGAMEKGVATAKKRSAPSIAEFEQPFDRAIELGRAYGFKRCAR